VRGISKLLWRVVLAAGVLFAAVILAALIFAPVVVERALLRELHARGLSDARLDVRAVGLFGATIEDVRLDPAGSLTVESVLASWSPQQLLSGEIQRVQVIGARWVVSMHGRSLDLGPLDELLRSRNAEDEGAELPVHRVELLASDVILSTSTREWRLPIEGALERVPDGFRMLVSAAPRATPVQLVAEVQQRPRRSIEFSLTATGEGDAALTVDGQVASEGPVDVQLRADDWSTDAMLAGRHVMVDGASMRGHATLTRHPFELHALQLELGTGEIQIDEQRLNALHVTATRGEEGIDVALEWSAPESEGVLGVRGLPTRLSAESLHEAALSWRAHVTASPNSHPTTALAIASSRLLRADDGWRLQIDEGRLALQAAPSRAELSASFVFAGTVAREHIAISAAQGDSEGTLVAGGMRGTLERLHVDVQAQRVEGRWDVQADAGVRVSPLVHAASGVRIDRVSASVALQYPLVGETAGERGRIRVGPVHWRGATLAEVRGDLVQRGDELVASLRVPLTAGVWARGRGRIALTSPLSAEVEITAPPFALEDSGPVVAFVRRASGGAVSGTAAFDGRFGFRRGRVTQTLAVRLDDVTVVGSSKLLHELHGLKGSLALQSVAPPLSAGGQRLTWQGARVGKLVLGAGHVDLAFERGRTIVVEELKTDVGEDGAGGRLFVGAFRWARDKADLQLDIFAEALSLQHWLDLLGRDEVKASGTLHGHVSAHVRLSPTLQVELGDGVLLAEPGGMLQLQDVRAAHALLAIRDAKALPNVVKQRLIEALQSLKYSSLRFELLRREGIVTLQVHVAGRGTRGARQEIGGLTININQFEDALNQLLRLRGGLERLGHVPSISSP
jgi:hypothetical protein